MISHCSSYLWFFFFNSLVVIDNTYVHVQCTHLLSHLSASNIVICHITRHSLSIGIARIIIISAPWFVSIFEFPNFTFSEKDPSIFQAGWVFQWTNVTYGYLFGLALLFFRPVILELMNHYTFFIPNCILMSSCPFRVWKKKVCHKTSIFVCP